MTPRFLVAAAAALLLAVTPAAAQFPIFDAHIHYSKPDWDAYPPERALAILAQAGVRRAIVSSTPDDGTLRLYERAPSVVVPFLRPYRTATTWAAGTGTRTSPRTWKSGSSGASTAASASSTWMPLRWTRPWSDGSPSWRPNATSSCKPTWTPKRSRSSSDAT